jgi:hypothetical protein
MRGDPAPVTALYPRIVTPSLCEGNAMPRKVKPTRPLTREELRAVAAEVIDERPNIRLDDIPPTRWSQLTDAEIAALPQAEKRELMREELVNIKTSITAHVKAQMPSIIARAREDLRKSQSELYQRKLQP